MDLNEAFRQAIKSYFNDPDYADLHTNKNRKYTKDYFTEIEKEYYPEDAEVDLKKEKKGKK